VRFWPLFLRNLKETYRDPLALAFLLAFPLMFMLLFGAAFGGDTIPVYDISVVDNDLSQVSEAFITEVLPEVPIFEVANLEDTESALKELRAGDISAYIVVPPGFGEQVTLSQQGQATDIRLDITYDESDLMVADQIITSIDAAARDFAGIEIPLTINSTRINLETEITQIDFIGPGIIIFGLLIMIPTAGRLMLRDKESRYLNRLLTTPTRPWEFIASYSVSMVALAIAQIAIFILLGWLFGMDIVGSIFLAFIIFLLTAICSIGIGMVVASISKSENQGESLSWLFSMPLAIISGVWFTIEVMPTYIRGLAYAFPFAHAVDASRAVITRGVGLEAISTDLLFLVGWAAVIFALGTVLFSRAMRS
jgi:ABC-2 type transport system permease protein